MLYLYLKAIHIVFVVSWMAGLFYIVRLFIYHTEANSRPSIEQKILFPQYLLMQGRLWNIITTPAMIIATLAAIGMLWLNPFLLQAEWFLLKLFFVLLLLGYHFICQYLLQNLKKGVFKLSSTQLRLWNEVATILLVAIVFTVILKNTLDWLWGVLGLIGLGVIIMLAVQLYKKQREKKCEA